jgi:hypothetical protein
MLAAESRFVTGQVQSHGRNQRPCWEPANLNSPWLRTVMLAFACTIGVGAFPHPRDPIEIPFEYSRAFGLILIKLEVNGKPAEMVLDTGSNETIVSPNLVILKQVSSKDAVAMAKGSGYPGKGVVATASLKVGPLSPKNCQILVVDLSDLSKTLGQDVDGILGMSVLKEFEMVSVDLKHHKLVLK